MHLRNQFAGLAMVVAASVLAPVEARAAVINFDSRQRGEIIANQYANYQGGVLINANNRDPSGPDVAAIFVANPNFTEPDPDLRPPYDKGNIAGVRPDRILIIPENVTDRGGGPNGGPNGLIDYPNDESQGGTITFTFKEQQRALGFDLIDFEKITPTQANGNYVRFFQGAVLVGEVTFRRFINSNSQFYDRTVKFGDNSANRIKPIRIEQFGPGATSFNRVEFGLGECAAIDRIDFTPGVVPEPGTAALALLGLGGLHLLTGRRRRA